MSMEKYPAEVQATAEAIRERAETDARYKARLQDDPVRVLLAAGLPENALRDFMRQEGLEAEVMGYMEELEDAW
jgi:hypothetical protein